MEKILNEILSELKSFKIETVNRLEKLEFQVSENTQILKALEHKVDVVKAEQEKSTYQIAEISGKAENINSKVELIAKDLNFVEIATGKNMSDIAHLKAIK